MNCQECTENLTAYLDHELSGTETTVLEMHVDACSKCNEELRSLRESTGFFDSNALEIELSPALWNNVRVRITPMPSPTGSSRFWGSLAVPRWARAATAVVAVFVLGLGAREYMQYHRSHKALAQYMTKYVQAREAQEVAHRASRAPATRAIHKEYSDNPFVSTTEEVSYSNPFREQGQ